MKRTILVGALAMTMTGCASLTQLAVETSLHAMANDNGMPPPELVLDEDEVVESMMKQSRAKVSIRADGPCEVDSRRTGRRTWRVDSCQGQTKCWVVEGGYQCRTEQQPYAL
jgi:hypothetical protein